MDPAPYDEKRRGGRLLPFRVPLPNPLTWRPWRVLGRGGNSSRSKPNFTRVATVATAGVTAGVLVKGSLSGATTHHVNLPLASSTAASTSGAATLQGAASAAPAVAPAAAQQQQSASRVPLKPATDVLAGAFARAASQSIIHPLDTLKVRLQTAKMPKAPPPTIAPSPASGLSKFGQLVPPPAATTGGPLSMPRLDVRAALAGLGSLYKGLVGAASGAGIALGAYFAFYGAACNALSRHTDLSPSAIAFVGGGAAALGSSCVKVPLAVCIRSVQAGVYPNVFNAAGSIVKAAGVRGLFTGYAPTVLEDVPDMAIKFAIYEALRQVHRNMVTGASDDKQQQQAIKPSPQVDFAMGAIAGAVAAAATTPLDVIKTNMMCNAAARPSMQEAAAMVLSQGGPAAFFRGVRARALSNGINSAVFFCFFEGIRGLFAAQQKAAAAAAVARAEQQAVHRQRVQQKQQLSEDHDWRYEYAHAADGGSRRGAHGSQLALATAAASIATQQLVPRNK